MRFPGICITFCLSGRKGKFIVNLAFGKIYLLYCNSKTITLTTNIAVIMSACSLVVKIFRVTESENAAVIWYA